MGWGSRGGVPRSGHQSGAQTGALSGPRTPVQTVQTEALSGPRTPVQTVQTGALRGHAPCSAPQVHTSLPLSVFLGFPFSSARITQEAGVVLVETDSPDFTRKKQSGQFIENHTSVAGFMIFRTKGKRERKRPIIDGKSSCYSKGYSSLHQGDAGNHYFWWKSSF